MKASKKTAMKLKGQLKSYLAWPIYIGLLFLVMNIAVYFIDTRAGILMSVFFVVYMIIVVTLLMHKRNSILLSMVEFSANYSQIQKQLLRELSIPYGILDENGKVLWMNDRFVEVADKGSKYTKSITGIFSSITSENFPVADEERELKLTHEERDYKVVLKRIPIEAIVDDSDILEGGEETFLIAMYMFDETEINQYIQYIDEQKFATALIYIDNYEEALASIEEVRKAVLVGLADRKINKYVNQRGGVVKKLEKDKYFAVFTYKALENMKSDRFSLLEEVKSINIGNEMAMTISIGIGTHSDEYIKNAELARTAMDLALGRGGDQVVLRDGDKVTYYGGKSEKVEKTTRVKARVKAHALREIINNKDKVFIMGHKLGDVDAFGAAVGIFRGCSYLNKKAYIVINDITTSVRPLLDKLCELPEYEKDTFVTGEEALELIDGNSVVVVVDVNKPSYTECPELLAKSRNIVVIDHHRQGSETIENPVLSYIEPNASSACEMVAEILNYFGEHIKIKPVEADAMYAGIIIDTNNFNNKTGVRTFEAAALLRRNGSDITKVRKLLRNDMNEYQARAEAVRNAEVYREAFAISISPSEGLESPTIIAAQAANELLNIIGIKASFVITEFNNQAYISARSIDEVNVQIIMEKLGGGGHMSIAGAQLADTDVEQAVEIVKRTLDTMLEEGEI